MKSKFLNILFIYYPSLLFGKSKYISLLLVILVSVLSGESQNLRVYDSVAVIKSKAAPEQIIPRLNLCRLHFGKDSNGRINFGIVGNGYYCLVVKLSGSGLKNQNLLIDNTSIDSISIFRIYNNKTFKILYEGGETMAFDRKRTYVWHTVPVEINKDPSFYLIALKSPQENINVKYEILNADDLQRKYESHDRVVFFYIGIVSFIIAIITTAFFLFRKAVFAAYLGYIICMAGWIISHYGYVFPYVYPQIPVINEIAKPVCSLGASFFLLDVLRLVFRKELQSAKWIEQLLKQTLYVLLLFIGLMFLLLSPDLVTIIKAFLMVAWHIGLIFSICVIVFTPLYFFYSGATAKIFAAAMFVICIVSVMQLFANSGYINNYFIEEHGVTMGSLTEISIMAFGLFYSLLEGKKQKETQVIALEQAQTEILKKLITIQDNERKRIANDLHDNIGPLIAALKINFGRIIHAKEPALLNGIVAKTESIIDDSIAEIRNVTHNLMPKGLSSNGLINTLKEYMECMQQLYGRNIVFTHQVRSILNTELQTGLYRIICELVLNAVKHSNAKFITVKIKTSNDIVSVSVYDDGQGFRQKDHHTKTLGLESAESRVLYFKGKFYLKTEIGKGTFIDIEIPLQLQEAQVNGF